MAVVGNVRIVLNLGGVKSRDHGDPEEVLEQTALAMLASGNYDVAAAVTDVEITDSWEEEDDLPGA